MRWQQRRGMWPTQRPGSTHAGPGGLRSAGPVQRPYVPTSALCDACSLSCRMRGGLPAHAHLDTRQVSHRHELAHRVGGALGHDLHASTGEARALASGPVPLRSRRRAEAEARVSGKQPPHCPCWARDAAAQQAPRAERSLRCLARSPTCQLPTPAELRSMGSRKRSSTLQRGGVGQFRA